MNLSSNNHRLDVVKLCCLILLFTVVATVNCQPMDETPIAPVSSNGETEVDSSSANRQQPLFENNRGSVGGRVKRGLSCYAGRSGCVSSCYLQGCSNGYCDGGWGGTCICYRCGNGR